MLETCSQYNSCFLCSLPTNVQAEAIPLILGGGDVLMAAETGSGKTGAFCLPVIQIVYESLKEKSGGGQKVGGVGGVAKKVVMNPNDRGDKLGEILYKYFP